MALKELEMIGEQPNNDAVYSIDVPYVAEVTIEGSAAILFHRWSDEDVEAKGKAAKNSKAKKTDNIETYVYRDEDGNVSIPGESLRMSIVNAGRYRQDPRSPRKSAMDLLKAGVIVLTEQASTGHRTWDYLDKRRVVIQRSAVTRTRPALLKGWTATFDVQVLLPEYIAPDFLLALINDAGRLCGLGDHRPTYGRFAVTSFSVQKDD